MKKVNEDITANDFPKEGEVFFFDQNYGSQKCKVKWTGNIVAGMIDGQGMGYMMRVEGDKRVYYTVKGTFQKGLPVGDVTYAVGNTLDNDADREVKRNYKYQMNVSPFSDGVAYFTKDHKKYGFLSADGKLVSKPIYDAVKNHTINGQFLVKYRNMDIVIDKNGNFLSIADGVTEIPSGYFNEERFKDLKSITIPKSVKMIRRGAFSNRKNLCQVTFLGTVSDIEGYAFSDCSSLTSIDLASYSNNILSFGVFKNCTSLRTVKLSPVITDIGDNAFEGCTSLVSISLPAKLTKIWKEAFKNCTSLTTITIPNHVESIGDNCFYGCTSLTSIVLPNSITTIGSKAFANCGLLSSATVPANLSSTAKGKVIFADCGKLRSVALRGTNGAKKLSTDWYWFTAKDPEIVRKQEAERRERELGAESDVVPSYKFGKKTIEMKGQGSWEYVSTRITFDKGGITGEINYWPSSKQYKFGIDDETCDRYRLRYATTYEYKTLKDVVAAMYFYVTLNEKIRKKGLCNPKNAE